MRLKNEDEGRDRLETRHTKRGSADLGFPSNVIAELLVKDGLGAGRIRTLRRGGALQLILVVPELDLLQNVASAVENMGADKARVVISERPKRHGATGDLSALIGVSGGLPSIHVCSDPEHVPAAFRAVSEATVTLGAVDGALVRRVMRRCCVGRTPASVESLDLTAIPLKVLCAAIARGTSATRAARALAMMTTWTPTGGDTWLPDLVDCHEYGDARLWCLRAMRDIADWSKGLVPDSQLQTSAIFVSDPGHGKTFLARVMAKSMGVPLLQLSMGELFKGDGHLHSTIAAMRATFAEAKAKKPVVLFIDEIDSFPRRGTGDRNDGYFTALVNELLAMIDGAGGGMPGIVLLAATNRPDCLDPALLRPGRFGTVLPIGRPDRRGIEHVFRVHLQGDLADIDISGLAAMAAGCSPAEIMGWVKAARSVAREHGRRLEAADIRTQVLGASPMSARDLHKVAVHESGHALAASLLGHPTGPLDYVSTVLSGDNAGHASMRSGNVDLLPGRRGLEDSVTVLLAGRAAEELIFGDEFSGGAGGPEGSDLFVATRMLASMQASLGMGGNLLWRASPDTAQGVLAGDPELRAVVENRLRELHSRARNLLAGQRHSLEAIVKALLERRVLSGSDVAGLIQPIGKRRPVPSRDDIESSPALTGLSGPSRLRTPLTRQDNQ